MVLVVAIANDSLKESYPWYFEKYNAKLINEKKNKNTRKNVIASLVVVHGRRPRG